jgi:flagellar biosynthetic protein FlhB
MAEKDQKTEQPTQRHLKKAREEGNFATARIFIGALQLLAFVWIVDAWGGAWIGATRDSMSLLLRRALDSQLDSAMIVHLGIDLAKRALAPLAIAGGMLLGVTLAGQLLVSRFGFSLKKLAPDFKRLNPLSRIRELPRQNIPALIQACIMLPIFAVTAYGLVRDDFDSLLSMPFKSVAAGSAQMAGCIQKLLWKAAYVFVIFGLVDFLRQKQRYQRDLRMSKQEIRDELKETEGNPLIKSRVRRLRRDAARRRMMHEIPSATAVIVNPTHYAVALKYAMHAKGAPQVVAKGKNYLALRIRQRAVEHQVPLIENPPLAQALYKSVEVGQEIPAQFYRAVAEILAYIYRLMNGRLSA